MILLRPTTCAITQRFGENPALYPATHGHMGIDYGTPEGTPIKAAAKGVVVFAGLDAETQRTPTAGYGNYVKLQHEGNQFTIYGHLSDLAVSPQGGVQAVGETVRQAQIVGRSGNTGRSTAPHLHFEYRTTATNAVDPGPYLVEKSPNVLMVGTITAAVDKLNVRSRPSTDGNDPLRKLRAGERVRIVGLVAVNSFLWLQLEDGSYIRGDSNWVDLEAV